MPGEQSAAPFGANRVGEVDEPIARDRVHIAREKETAVGGTVQHAAVFQFYGQHAVKGGLLHGFDGQVGLQRLEPGNNLIAGRRVSRRRQRGGQG